ncbi:hypothetical protein Tco_0945758 [Tanacetum coccineum]
MKKRLNEPTHADCRGCSKGGASDAEMIALNRNANLKTEVPVTSSSHSSDLASKFLNFADIPPLDAEIVSPMDVHVHHEVPSSQTPTLLTVSVLVLTESSPIYASIPYSLPSFTHPPPRLTPTLPPPPTEVTNPLSTLPDFASIFQFNNRVSALEKEVSDLKQDDLLKTQVTTLVDEHLNSRLGATRDEFMSFLPASITAKITEQVKTQLPQSYDLDKSLFSTYGNVYSLKRSRNNKDKDEDPSTGSDRGLKKRKISKDAEPTKGPKTKESKSGLSKGTKSQPKSSGKSVQSDEP